MPNANYQRGRRFEYERKAIYEGLGADVTRASGSHGTFDLVVLWPNQGVVEFIQLKVTKDRGTAERLLSDFRASPPFKPMKYIHQRMEVKVTGSKEVHSVTV